MQQYSEKICKTAKEMSVTLQEAFRTKRAAKWLEEAFDQQRKSIVDEIRESFTEAKRSYILRKDQEASAFAGSAKHLRCVVVVSKESETSLLTGVDDIFSSTGVEDGYKSAQSCPVECTFHGTFIKYLKHDDI